MLVVGEALDFHPDLVALLGEGYVAHPVPRLEATLPLIEGGGVQALILAAGPRAASDLLLLRRIRAASPRTSVVVVSRTTTDPDLKRAFESGATAFLSWPASSDAVRHAIDPGAPTASAASRP